MLTLAYQLSTQLPEYRSYLLNLKLNDIEYDFKDSLISLFDILFLKPLRHIKSDRPLVFVIDALDELTKFTEQGTPFLSLLTDGFTRLPEWFGLMVTSRPDPELLRRMKSLDPLILQADNESNINDLLQFTREKLRNMGLSPSADIIGNLVNRSFGNILYLKETLAEVQKGRISIENIDSFPIGLSDYYSQFFDRQFSDKFRYRELVKPLLELLTVVNSPLPISLISQILEWDDYKLDDALLELGGLFPLENNCIRPFHKSVADWLVNPDLSGRSVRINGKYGAKKLIAKLWPDYEHDKRPFTEFINYLLPALLFNEEWDMLESILIDKRTPLLSTYVYVNRFPEKWDFTKIKKRIFDLNRFTWEKASEGIPTDNQELFQSFAVFMDIASHRTAPWFYELIQINSKAPNLPAFFKSSFSDIKCALHMNPIKVRTYYAVKKVLAKLVMLGIELPAKANQFLIELRKSSLYMDGSYLLNESPDPDILFRGFELMYQGDFIENDCLFNTMSLIIELDQGKADPSFVKKLLVYGADATATRKGISLDLYAENQGHIEVAKIIKKHLASKT